MKAELQTKHLGQTLEALKSNMEYTHSQAQEVERKLADINTTIINQKGQLKLAKKNNPDAVCRIPDDRMRILREAIKSANTTND